MNNKNSYSHVAVLIFQKKVRNKKKIEKYYVSFDHFIFFLHFHKFLFY